MAEATKTEPRKVTTHGMCPLCGSGSCLIWRHAALTPDGHVDSEALMAAHGVEPDVVEHDEKGNPTKDGALPLVPMAMKESGLYRKHGGRIAPLPMKKGARR